MNVNLYGAVNELEKRDLLSVLPAALLPGGCSSISGGPCKGLGGSHLSFQRPQWSKGDGPSDVRTRVLIPVEGDDGFGLQPH